MSPILQVHPSDDALVALRDLEAGALVSLKGQSWTLREKIPAKQKFAAQDFAIVGDLITMYGVTVGKSHAGRARQVLCMHTRQRQVHASAAFAGKQSDYSWTPPDVSKWKNRTFNGFKRSHGPAGTANHWVVIPLVFCENRNLGFMREALVREPRLRQNLAV
jgi:altronate hydrolase